MTTQNDPNNQALRELVDASGLPQPAALLLFNRGLDKPYSLSAWKAFLADPHSARWRRFDARLLARAQKKLSAKAKGD